MKGRLEAFESGGRARPRCGMWDVIRCLGKPLACLEALDFLLKSSDFLNLWWDLVGKGP